MSGPDLTADEAQPVFKDDPIAFVGKYCASCHGEEKPKAGLNLTEFSDEAAILADRVTWKRVLDEVQGFSMPPTKNPQPTPAERDRFIASVEDLLARPGPDGVHDPGRPVLRRLNRLEYNNTVRDLLGLPFDVFMFSERLPLRKDYFPPSANMMPERLTVRTYEYGAKLPVLLPAAGLPADNRAAHGFTNRGSALNLSPLLLEKYLSLGKEIVHHPRITEFSPVLRELFADPQHPATEKVLDKPSSRRFVPALNTFAPTDNVTGSAEELNRVRTQLKQMFDKGRGGVYDGSPPNKKAVIRAASDAIRVTFGHGETAAKKLVITPDRDLWLVAFGTADPTSGKTLIANHSKNVKKYALSFSIDEGDPDEQVMELSVVVLSRNNQSGTVKLTVVYNTGETTTLSKDIPAGAGAANTLYTFVAPDGAAISTLKVDGSEFSGEYVLLDDIGFVTSGEARTMKSPPPVAGTPKASRPPIEPRTSDPLDIARSRLKYFLGRAFRRPPTPEEIDRYHALFASVVGSGKSFEEGMRAAVRAILASPSFLYLTEMIDHQGGKVRELNSHELANRLSYFLWASMPDEELFRLADEGQLTAPTVLEAQAQRMLKDPRARELSESFAVQWLRLNELWSARPDRKQYRAFYSGPMGKDTLAVPMLVEALLLFETTMIEDRSIRDLIDPGFAYLTPRLMSLYNLDTEAEKYTRLLEAELPPASPGAKNPPKPPTNVWFRVPLSDRNRGGILTMGGPLTLTSLPYRTSPVKRGEWVLEVIFNRPPPPPTVAVDPLEKSGEGTAKSVRQQLELHRSQANCAACHAKIDPPGFALETFDPIGAWRTEDGGNPIDAKGQLTDGRTFDGPAEFKDAILARETEFIRGFSEQLLSYALGRELTFADMTTVKELMATAEKDDYRFSRLIAGVVTSYPFRHTRNTDEENP